MRRAKVWTSEPTNRELQCLANMLLHGTKEGSLVLGISEKTLKNSLTSLYSRLDVENSREAAIALGWLDIPPHLVDSRWRPGRVLPESRHPAAEALLSYAEALLREFESK